MRRSLLDKAEEVATATGVALDAEGLRTTALRVNAYGLHQSRVTDLAAFLFGCAEAWNGDSA